eukprot:17474_1
MSIKWDRVFKTGKRRKKRNYDCNRVADESDDEFGVQTPPNKRQKIRSTLSRPIHYNTVKQRIRKNSKRISKSNRYLGKSIARTSLLNLDEPSKRTRKKKRKSSKTKTKKNRRKRQQNKTTKTSVCCDMNKDQAAIVIDGYFRRQLQHQDNKPGQLPKDIVDLICLYRDNIRYVIINFVWTHKHHCDCRVASCKVLKRNRGNYTFKRERNNAYDPNAIAIYGDVGSASGTTRVGYIPRDYAFCLARPMDSNVIELKSIGGMVGKACEECIEIVHLDTSQPLSSALKHRLEKKHYESFKRIICQ